MIPDNQRPFTLEVAAHSLTSAIAAAEAGAHRIELCVALEVGGLTPGMGLLKQVRDEISLPINVLIRPRTGNFCYDSSELRTIQRSIEVYKTEGVNGFVFGCLTANDEIDRSVVDQVMSWVDPLPFTFHRAFDCVRDPYQSLRQLASCSVRTVLTSGQSGTAWEGRELLKSLISMGENIEIMAGSGIHGGNIRELADYTGIRTFHSSAKTFQEGLSSEQHQRISMLFGKMYERDGKWESSQKEINRMIVAMSMAEES
ncbi:MAG: hypothetical protein OEQ53_01955 [Saprospiraceae bacterium]|nr:hypothetical protein [Saprospiraceae bacterium]